jgi:hypothetical protein
LAARAWCISIITSLLIALAIIITMVATIITAEASRYLAGTVVFRKVTKTAHVLVDVSVVIFFG